MQPYTVVEVHSKKHIRDFHQLPQYVYRNTKEWIQPLTKDVEAVFSPQQNTTFLSAGTIKRWNLYEGERIVGRIAAFVHKHYTNKGDSQPTGGIGFFESIDERSVAHRLFDVAKLWLTEQGMEAMDGPINFGERNQWWGLLVEGFQPPSYGMNYHLPYYKDLFLSYGFEVFYEQYCFSIDIQKELSKVYELSYQKWSNDKDISLKSFEPMRLKKYAEDFVAVYNAAWASHEGMKEMPLASAIKLFKKIRWIIDPRFTFFVYYQGKPIAFWLNLPELNTYVQFFHGKWNFFSPLKFLWLSFFVKPQCVVGIVFGIVPEWQGRGIDRYMIACKGERSKWPPHYKEFLIQWIGDFNPKMISIAHRLFATRCRTLWTMRYLFDRKKPFERHPML